MDHLRDTSVAANVHLRLTANFDEHNVIDNMCTKICGVLIINAYGVYGVHYILGVMAPCMIAKSCIVWQL